MSTARYSFIDAQTMHRENPSTFQVPKPEDIQRLNPGATVKVGASFDKNGPIGHHPSVMADWISKVGGATAMGVTAERFWVIITKIDGDLITGTVDNDLVYTAYHGLEYGDTVTFELKNILST